jgi:hypothetical protein
MAMFTFGRKTETDVALRRHGGQENAVMIVAIVNSVHDLLEGGATLEEVEKVISYAFVEGRRDVWGAAGTWLLNVQEHYPSASHVWLDLAQNPIAEVRFRVACHIIDLPEATCKEVYALLKDDKSKKVRTQAEGNWDYRQNPEKYA